MDTRRGKQSEVSAYEPKDRREGRDGGGDKYRKIYLREMAALSKSFWSKPVPGSDEFQEMVGRKCVQNS